MTIDDEVGVITLQRPERLNALTTAMRLELAAVIRSLGNRSDVRGLVITGAGRAFSAGEDLVEARAAAARGNLVPSVEAFHDLTRAVLAGAVPVVGALNGITVGGACEFTLCFDARIGTAATEMFFPENSRGLTISNAASVLLARVVGGHQAQRLILDSARLSADQAHRLGLLDGVVEPGYLVAKAREVIDRWSQGTSTTTAHLRLLRPSLAAVEAAFRAETAEASEIERSGLAHTGITRFLDSRKAPVQVAPPL